LRRWSTTGTIQRAAPRLRRSSSRKERKRRRRPWGWMGRRGGSVLEVRGARRRRVRGGVD
ncbi:hypothetical protein LTS02_018063, partial [Friedmanniomyces endolithicus]